MDAPIEARLLSARGGFLRLRQASVADESRNAPGDRAYRGRVRGASGVREGDGDGARARIARRDGGAVWRRPRRSLTRPELPRAVRVPVRSWWAAPAR